MWRNGWILVLALLVVGCGEPGRTSVDTGVDACREDCRMAATDTAEVELPHPSCTPGTRVCASPTVLMVCNDKGNGWLPEAECDAEFPCDAGCCPQCEGKQCGQDGCGGVCGECGEGAVCEGSLCVWGVCTGGDLLVDGMLLTDSGEVEWTQAEVEMNHSLEGTCVTRVKVTLKDGDCSLVVEAAGRVDGAGWIEATNVELVLDSQCSPTGQSWSGEAHGAEAGRLAWLKPANSLAWESGAARACLHSSVILRTAGSLESSDDSEALTLPEHKLTVIGEFVSTAQGECPCFYSCYENECGDDGCGQECGTCEEFWDCLEGVCVKVCLLNCQDKECGEDGCGGLCGVCGPGAKCEEGTCKQQCPYDCIGKQCGADGCGGVCGQCPPFSWCQEDGTCATACSEMCADRECGPDGCGGSCGTCNWGQWCDDEGMCNKGCLPECGPWECGTDLCGGIYGECQSDLVCVEKMCVGPEDCPPNCNLRQCGPDGCAGSCGVCPDDILCTNAGWCGSSCASCGHEEDCLDYSFPQNLSEWTYTHAAITADFEGIVSEDGGYMLVMRTGPEMDVDWSEAYLQNCLPAGQYAVQMRWKLVSEEFMEYCESFVDWVEVELLQGEDVSKLLYVDVSQFCLQSNFCGDDCPWFGAELEPMGLPFEDAWATPWLESTSLLQIGNPEQPFTLRFFASDEGGAGFPTFFILDRLVFAPCETGCADYQCGESPCGEHCGYCAAGYECVNGHCCNPDCGDRECGTLCGQSCGKCAAGEECSVEGACVAAPICEPDCDGKECGVDGCGGGCGECMPLQTCIDGQCCTPDCQTNDCGDDGCGSLCGVCGLPDTCADGECQCEPDCDGKECGEDGCGQQCGTCSEGLACDQGQCLCTPNAPPVVAQQWTYAVSPEPGFSTGDGARALLDVPGGGVVVAGGHYPDNTMFAPYLMELDADGAVAWTASFGAEATWDRVLGDAARRPSGDMVLAGRLTSALSGTPEDCWVIGVSPEGKQQWEQLYPGEGAELGKRRCDINDIDLLPDGGFVVAGQMSASSLYGDLNSWLARAAPNGELLWTHLYDPVPGDSEGPDEFGGVVTLQDGTFAVVANTIVDPGKTASVWLLVWSQDGDLAQITQLPSLLGTCTVSGFEGLSDGRLALAYRCRENSIYSESLQMLVTDVDGTIHWQWNCHRWMERRPRGITVLPGGDLLVVGQTEVPASEPHGWAMRMSPDGEQIWERTFLPGICLGIQHALVDQAQKVWLSGSALSDQGGYDTAVITLGEHCFD